MTIRVAHKFISQKPDGTDPSVIRPSNWNDTHTLEVAGQTLLGKSSAGQGAANEITLGAGLRFGNGLIELNPTYPNDYDITGSLTVRGGSIYNLSGQMIMRAKDTGSAHLEFQNPNGAERGLIWAANGNTLNFRAGGGGQALTIHPTGETTFGFGGAAITTAELRDVRQNALRGLRTVFAGDIQTFFATTGWQGNIGQAFPYEFYWEPYPLPQGSGACWVITRMRMKVVQGFSAARGWFNIDAG